MELNKYCRTATQLHPPDRDAPYGSARSCWVPTGWADWACSGRARSWSWTWACEPEGSGAPRPEENRRRPSWDERTRPGPEPAGRELERSWSPPSHRRSWCSRSPLLSGTDPTHCCVWEERVWVVCFYCGPDIKSPKCFITSCNSVRALPQPENFIPSCFFNVVFQFRKLNRLRLEVWWEAGKQNVKSLKHSITPLYSSLRVTSDITDWKQNHPDLYLNSNTTDCLCEIRSVPAHPRCSTRICLFIPTEDVSTLPQLGQRHLYTPLNELWERDQHRWGSAGRLGQETKRKM